MNTTFHIIFPRLRMCILKILYYEIHHNFFVIWKNFFSLDTIYPTPPLGQDMTQGQFFKWSLTGLNSEFSFS